MEEEKELIDDSEMFLGYLLFEKFVKYPNAVTKEEMRKLEKMGVNT
jgi:hypothetical protein